MKRTVMTVAMCLLTVAAVGARDFSESPRAVLLPDAYAVEGVRFAPGAWAEAAFTSNAIRDGEYDTFQIRSYANFGVLAGPSTLGTVFYGSYLLSGPVNEGTEPGSDRAPWLMNAVQFEYGVTIQQRIGDWTILAEYSRRSSHPLRQVFEDPAADILRVGVAPPGIERGPWAVSSLLRLGWVELYDYWNVTTIPDPRVLYTANIAAQGDYRLPIAAAPLSLFGILLWDPFLLRSGGVDGDLELDIGLGIGERMKRIELYGTYYRSSDTEQGLDKPVPVVLIGYGIRFVAAL